MNTYKNYWEAQDRDWHKFGALRARNLAEEIVVGWTDQTGLSGFDLQLTCQAVEFYGEMIRDGRAESHCDDVVRGLLALHCDRIADEGGERKEYGLCWAETMLAARALKAFSEYLQGRLDELPAPAKAA